MTKKVSLVGLATIIVTTMSAGAQQPAPPENAAV